jgi:K+-transporting ATPase KdpF subunit
MPIRLSFTQTQRRVYGRFVFGICSIACACDLWVVMRLQSLATSRGINMNGWEILAGVLAAGLLVYLIAVLLRPEDFS